MNRRNESDEQTVQPTQPAQDEQTEHDALRSEAALCQQALSLWRWAWPNTINCDGGLRVFDGGRYRIITPTEFEVAAREMFAEYNSALNLRMKKASIDHLYSVLLSEVPKVDRHAFEQFPHMLAFRDATLDVRSMTVHEHSPSCYTTTIIDANIGDVLSVNPSAVQDSSFLYYVNSICGGDANMVAVMAEFMGYVLSEYNHIKKCFVLVGASDSGKSAFQRLLSRLVGDDLTVAVNQKRAEPRAFTATTLFARLRSTSWAKNSLPPLWQGKNSTQAERFRLLNLKTMDCLKV